MLLLKIESLGISEAVGIAVLGFVIVLVVLAFLMLFVKLLSTIISGTWVKTSDKKKEKKASVDEAPVSVKPAASAIQAPTPIANTATQELPYTPGYVTLDGVSEQDAAVIMAITSHKMGISLDRLCFKSIKRLNQEPVFENIEEQDAAVIMAITADKIGVPIENLCFNSIKLVEE